MSIEWKINDPAFADDLRTLYWLQTRSAVVLEEKYLVTRAYVESEIARLEAAFVAEHERLHAAAHLKPGVYSRETGKLVHPVRYDDDHDECTKMGKYR